MDYYDICNYFKITESTCKIMYILHFRVIRTINVIFTWCNLCVMSPSCSLIAPCLLLLTSNTGPTYRDVSTPESGGSEPIRRLIGASGALLRRRICGFGGIRWSAPGFFFDAMPVTAVFQEGILAVG